MTGHARDGRSQISGPEEYPSWPDLPQYPYATIRPATGDVWQPEAGAGFVIGGALLALLALLDLVMLREALTTPGAMKVIWLLLFLVLLGATTTVARLVLRLRSLRYVLGPDALIVLLRGGQIAVPYEAIDDVILRPRDRIDIAGYERYWPGYRDARVATSEGLWRSIATTPPNRRVRIHVHNRPVLAISPQRPVLFVEALGRRRGAARPAHMLNAEPPEPALFLNTSHAPELHSPRPRQEAAPRHPRQRAPVFTRPAWLAPPEAWTFFRERVVRADSIASNLLALSLIALILLVTLTSWRADAVGTPVAIRWNAAGEPVEWVRPDGFWIFEGVWIFPATAGAVIVINAALATLSVYLERLREARMLLAAALPVQVILMLALWRATS